MNAISDLQQAFFRFRFRLDGVASCIAWAIERLQADEEQNDLEITLLAGATDESEAAPLVETILERYIGGHILDEQLLCGKYVTELHRDYVLGKISIAELEPVIWNLCTKLGNPSWLDMLSRNCEYATDVEPFVKPFEEEFNYIAKLWEASSSSVEFTCCYDRNVSNAHDVNR